MKCFAISLMTFLFFVGCDSEKNQPVSLDRALSLAYDAGLDIDLIYRHHLNCQDVIDVDWHYVPRTQAGAERAVRALDLVSHSLRATPNHCPEAILFLSEVRRDMTYDFRSFNQDSPHQH